MKYTLLLAALLVECPHGLDGNGNCLKEGADPRPYGGKGGKEGH